MRMSIVRVLSGTIMCIAILTICVVLPTRAKPAFSWLDSGIQAEVATDLPTPHIDLPSDCTIRQVYVDTQTNTQDVCMYDGDGFQYGTVNASEGLFSYTLFAVRIGGDERMHTVYGMPFGATTAMPHSKNMIYSEYGYGRFTRRSYLITDFVSQLDRTPRPDKSMGYSLKAGAAKPLIVDEHGSPVNTWSVGASEDGRWVISEVANRGFVRLDITNHTMRWYSSKVIQHTWLNPEPEFAISNDGARIAMVGQMVEPVVTELDDTCGRMLTNFASDLQASNLTDPCQEQSLYPALIDAHKDYFDKVIRPKFSYDSGELLVHLVPYRRPNTAFQEQWIRLAAAHYQRPDFKYLALGDSFSSGEGDLEVNSLTGAKYYREFTDVDGVPEEKCHVSTRSYPYIVAKELGFVSQIDRQWQTVACSGAVVRDDYNVKDQYLGQRNSAGDPRLESVRNAVPTYTLEAYSRYIPGRISQLNFVKRTQPRIITLTGGGNDIGFGDILRSCASSLSTCDYVTSTDKRAQVAKTIQDEYQTLTDLYRQIHTLSPSTKIYAIGYPQFLSDEPRSCNINVRLTREDRKFVREGVSYLNKVIRAAAKSAGVMYIDAENVFGDHILCGKENSYVNGVNLNCTPLKLFSGSDQCIESYHPMSVGHAFIAYRILQQTNDNPILYQYCRNGQSVCPDDSPPDIDIPKYFVGTVNTSIKNTRASTLTSPNAIQKAHGPIDLNVSGLAPSSTVRVYMHSDLVELGSYTVGSDGVLKASIPAPDSVSAGYHTLYVDTETPSGEPVTLWQVVRVLGLPGDVDENGIADVNQPCLFMEAAGKDSDGDGVDDACDVQMGAIRPASTIMPPTQPLGEDARLAVAEKVFAGQSTTASYVGQEESSRQEVLGQENRSLAADKHMANAKKLDLPVIIEYIGGVICSAIIVKYIMVLRKRYAK